MTTSRLRWLVLCTCLLLPACQQEMAKQPNYHKPLQPSDFFPDGRSARPLPAGVVAQGQPRDASPLVRYRQGQDVELGRVVFAVTSPNLGTFVALAASPPSTSPAAEYADRFPILIDAAAMRRGQERYTIFCAVCHDPLGTGQGKIVERGYLQPPSYHTDWSRGFERRGIRLRLRDAPVGYYFEVVTKGFGGMPDYASQISPEDRWKIIAYVRALQLSQYAPVEKLSETTRRQALQELEKQR